MCCMCVCVHARVGARACVCRAGATMVGTSGVTAVGVKWRGFDLLINGGYSLLLQVANFNAGHSSKRFLQSQRRVVAGEGWWWWWWRGTGGGQIFK